jgi:DNA-binding IclR family transcriptional regulator
VLLDSATALDHNFAMQNNGAAPVAAVDRALRLLVLLRGQGRVSVTQAADHLGVAPSTAHRLLNALCYRDFAVQDRDRQYRAGPQLSETLSSDLSVAALRRLIRPAIQQLHDRTGETTHLVVLSGGDVRFIDGVEAEQALRIGLRTGIRLPAYCTSGGKALLAALPPGEVDRLYRRGLPSWPNASVRDLAALHRQLATVRRRGYGLNEEESEQGVAAVGAAVHDPAGRPVAALSVSIPTARFRRSALASYADAVLSAVTEADARLRELDAET